MTTNGKENWKLTKLNRATENRGTRESYRPESNDRGNFSEIIKDRNFLVSGFNIGSASLAKPGIAPEMKRIRSAYLKDPTSKVIIRGSTSSSVHTGKNDDDLRERRAASAKAALVREGIPESAIEVAQNFQEKSNPRATSPAQKSAARSVTVEVIPQAVKPRRDIRVYDDNPPLVTIPPKHRFDWKPPPEWTKTAKFLRTSATNALGKASVAAGAGILLVELLPDLAAIIAIDALMTFLPELVEKAAEEYGVTKVKKYIKDKLEKKIRDRRPERDEAEQKKFMNEMLRRIIAKESFGHSPLSFLVDLQKGTWKSRSVYDEYGVNAGHVLSAIGYGFSYAIESSWLNQKLRPSKTEQLRLPDIGISRGLPVLGSAYKIDDVYVDRDTAKYFESQGWLPAGTCDKAKSSVGWIDF